MTNAAIGTTMLFMAVIIIAGLAFVSSRMGKGAVSGRIKPKRFVLASVINKYKQRE